MQFYVHLLESKLNELSGAWVTPEETDLQIGTSPAQLLPLPFNGLRQAAPFRPQCFLSVKWIY